MTDLRIVDAPVLLQESITDDVKMPTGGLGNFSVRLGDILWYVITKEQLADKNYVDLSSKGVKDSLDEHIADKANPHQVTKAQVGLGNVDNTADIDKPVSNAVNSAITTATTDMATKTYVNSKDGDLTTLTTTDKTSLVKAINEVVNVKANKDETATSIKILADNKADKATTLEGYGIIDAYTKSEIDTNYGGVKTLYDKNVEAGVGANGWVASLVQDASGLTQQQINDYNHVKSPEIFGAKGMAVNDQAVFTNLSANYIYALAKEYTVPVWRSPAKTVIGNNTKINVDSVNGDTTVAVQIPANSNYSNIDFVNNATQDKPWSYATVGNGATLNNIGFYNFKDLVSNNSWGVLLDNRSDIVFNSPKFGNNGLADIAITDNVKNITINNATNLQDSGVYLDIEPNGADNIENIKVDGGHYRKISVLPNSYLSLGIDNLNITNAVIDELEIRGGRVRISSSKVGKIKGNWSSLDYAGLRSEGLADLEINCVNLSKNMILDEFVNDFAASNNKSYWVAYSEATASIVRLNDNGYYTALNNNKTSYTQLTTRDFIELNGVKTIAVMMSYSVNNSVDTLMFEPILVDFYDANGNFIAPEYSIKGGQTLQGTNFDWSTGVAIFDVPANAAKIKLALRSNKAKSTLNVRKIGVYGVTMTDGDGNFNSELQGYKKLNVTKNLKAQQALSYSIDANAVKATDVTVIGAKIGDTVQVSTTSPMGSTSRIWAEVSADNTLSIYHQNLTATVLAINTTANFTIQ